MEMSTKVLLFLFAAFRPRLCQRGRNPAELHFQFRNPYTDVFVLFERTVRAMAHAVWIMNRSPALGNVKSLAGLFVGMPSAGHRLGSFPYLRGFGPIGRPDFFNSLLRMLASSISAVLPALAVSINELLQSSLDGRSPRRRHALLAQPPIQPIQKVGVDVNVEGFFQSGHDRQITSRLVLRQDVS